MSAHSLFSPSAASRWMACAGSLALTAGSPRTSSKYAAEGTAMHEIAATCLEKNLDADAFIDTTIVVEGFSFDVDLEMAAYIQTYVDEVRELARGVDGEIMVEQRVDFSHVIDQPDSSGTSDAVIVSGDAREATIVDLKGGRGVKVDAEDNEQLMLYALGALDLLSMVGEFDGVTMVISQPRLGHSSVSYRTVEQLLAFGEQAKAAAQRASDAIAVLELGGTPEELLDKGFLVTGEKQCRFCDAKASCPALTAAVAGSILNDDARGTLADLVDFNTYEVDAAPEALPALADISLARKMEMADLVEIWVKAVRAEVEARLISGRPVEGWKLVEGKRGARQWVDKREAEATLKSMRLPIDVMYDLSLISPTSADKLAKAGTIGPRQWPRLKSLITQSPGKPHVAPAGDPRGELVASSALVDLESDTPTETQAHPFR